MLQDALAGGAGPRLRGNGMIYQRNHERRPQGASLSFITKAMSKAAPIAGVAMACFLLLGCPLARLTAPVLTVDPGAIDFGAASDRESFTIYNGGGRTINWTLTEVVWNGDSKTWVAQDIPWLTTEDGIVSGTTSTETDRIFLIVNRQGLAGGAYTGAGVMISSNAGTATVALSMTVVGSEGEGEGEGEVVVDPQTIHINGVTSVSTFTVTNNGTAIAHWYTEVMLNAPNAPVGTPIQIAVSPADAVTAPNDHTVVTVGIPDPNTFDSNYLNYTIAVRDRASGTLYAEVQVAVELINPAVIAVKPTVLDFGTEGYQLSFYVANLGDINSRMDFAIFQMVEGTADNPEYVPYDVLADPLIAVISAPEGMDDVLSDVDNDPWVYMREVAVTIDRDGIEQDVEYRPLYVGVVLGTDAAGKPIIDPTVKPVKVDVRVEAVPYVEGAINRARPPSIMRFVFMLRDKRGIAINAGDPLIRDLISFYVEEDKFPLDLDETSLFMAGPENLSCNVMMLLDFTGSMYMAGTRDPLNPLLPGEAIDMMVAGAKQFILDLPDGYRVGIMEYHDVRQPKRLIHGFDTNKASLVAALDGFSLPVSEHGASAVYDAVYDAAAAVLAEDAAGLLPFDETDIRSVIFISDGWDTSSSHTPSDTTTFAKDNRIRLYPIGFSGSSAAPVNDANLIPMGTDTGGHVYHALEAADLAKLLDTERGMSFGAMHVDLRAGTVTLEIRNKSANPLTWNIVNIPNFITVSPASGTTPPLQRNDIGAVTENGVRTVTFTIAGTLATGTYLGTFNFTSDDGNGMADVTVKIDAGGALTNFAVVPHTEDVGRIWRELQGQIVLTYASLFQEGSHTYLIKTTFPDSNGKQKSASFQKNGVFWPGDTRAGQISLTTTGISNGAAEVYVRTDYVPRNITQFRFRFIPSVPEDLTPGLTPAERATLLANLKTALDQGAVSLAPEGLIANWRIVPDGYGVFLLVTEVDNYLQFATFGNLLKVTFDNLGPNDAFELGFRVDNTWYIDPGFTKYFMYPGSLWNPDGRLVVDKNSNLAGPAGTWLDFELTPNFNPDAPNAWDRDGDSIEDFDDSGPDNKNVGDADHDGTPDLNDPAPYDPNVP